MPIDSAVVYCLSDNGPPRSVVVQRAAPGSGRRVLLGHQSGAMQDSMHVAISWAQAQLPRLAAWLLRDAGDMEEEEDDDGGDEAEEAAPWGGGCRVVGEGWDVLVSLSGLSVPKDGSSAAAAVAVSLALCALRRRGVVLRPGGTAVVGEVDLAGGLLPVGALVEKLGRAQRAGLARVVAPAEQARALLDGKRGPLARRPQLRRYAKEALRPAASMAEALAHVLTGAWRAGGLS